MLPLKRKHRALLRSFGRSEDCHSATSWRVRQRQYGRQCTLPKGAFLRLFRFIGSIRGLPEKDVVSRRGNWLP